MQWKCGLQTGLLTLTSASVIFLDWALRLPGLFTSVRRCVSIQVSWFSAASVQAMSVIQLGCDEFIARVMSYPSLSPVRDLGIGYRMVPS